MKIQADKICFYSLLGLWVVMTFSPALTEILFVAALVTWLSSRTRTQKWLEMPNSLFIPFAVYVLICIFSAFWSEYPPESLRGIFKVLQHVLLFWIVQSVLASPSRLKKFERVFWLSMALVIFNGFYQYAAGHDLLRGFPVKEASSGTRLSSSFKSYGLYASYLILTLPAFAVLTFNYRKQPKTRWLGVFCLFIFLSGVWSLYLTRSRGAILSLAAGILGFLLYRRQFRFLLFVLALFTGGLLLLPKSAIIHLDGYGKEQSVVERYYLWHRAWDVIKAKPFTGTGINTYARSHAKYDTKQNWRVRDYYAHNGYLQLGAEVGLPALAFFLWFLIRYFIESSHSMNALRAPPSAAFRSALLLGLLNFLILSSIDTVLHNEQALMPFWYMLGLQWATLKSAKQGKTV